MSSWILLERKHFLVSPIKLLNSVASLTLAQTLFLTKCMKTYFPAPLPPPPTPPPPPLALQKLDRKKIFHWSVNGFRGEMNHPVDRAQRIPPNGKYTLKLLRFLAKKQPSWRTKRLLGSFRLISFDSVQFRSISLRQKEQN
jgi:hypothetical protein